MKAKEVWYEKKFNTAKYETETFGILAQLDEGEKAVDILPFLKRAVHKIAGQKMTATEGARLSQDIIDCIDDLDTRTEES